MITTSHYSDGPFRLIFDSDKRKFIVKTNPDFALLNKANQFKIDNPPDFSIDDVSEEYYDERIDNFVRVPRFEMSMYMRLPIKISDDKIITTEQDSIIGLKYDSFAHEFDDDGYILLKFTFELGFNSYVKKVSDLKKNWCFTKKCYITPPKCFYNFTKKDVEMYKDKLSKREEFEILNSPILKRIKDFNSEERYKFRLHCMIKGLQKFNYCSYGSVIVFCK